MLTETNPERAAVLFDLDGVLTDTAELHYRSWQRLTDDLGLPFDRAANEALRGLSRPRSLELVLGDHAQRFTPDERRQIARRKNDEYLRLVSQMSPRDTLPGVREVLADLRKRGVRVAVASSSRNARAVIDRLELAPSLDAIVDGNDIEHSKPAPDLFLAAARCLDTPPERCVVVEDAASGVEAARVAGMKVVGIGPHERVGDADLVLSDTRQINAERLLALLSAGTAGRET